MLPDIYTAEAAGQLDREEYDRVRTDVHFYDLGVGILYEC